MAVEFQDFTIHVTEALEDAALQWLEEAGSVLQRQAANNTRVGTGETAGKWDYMVDEGTKKCEIGNPLQNAIWEEFGTGEHALEGNGRKGGWTYKDEEGHWHHTYGKKARRPFWKAYSSLKNQLIKFIQDKVKGAMK